MRRRRSSRKARGPGSISRRSRAGLRPRAYLLFWITHQTAADPKDGKYFNRKSRRWVHGSPQSHFESRWQTWRVPCGARSLIGLMEPRPFGSRLNEVWAAQTCASGRIAIVACCLREAAGAGCGRSTASAGASATGSPARYRRLELSQRRRLHRIGFQQCPRFGCGRVKQHADIERPDGTRHSDPGRPIRDDRIRRSLRNLDGHWP